MYMSYCRHEGTLHELRACLADVEDHINGAAEYTVSQSEIECFKDMVAEFVRFLQDAELIDENGDLDEAQLEDVAERMAQAYEEEDY